MGSQPCPYCLFTENGMAIRFVTARVEQIPNTMPKIGLLCHSPSMNTIQVNVGTGAFVLLPVNDSGVRSAGLLTGITYSDVAENSYCLEGTVNGAEETVIATEGMRTVIWARGTFTEPLRIRVTRAG